MGHALTFSNTHTPSESVGCEQLGQTTESRRGGICQCDGLFGFPGDIKVAWLHVLGANGVCVRTCVFEGGGREGAHQRRCVVLIICFFFFLVGRQCEKKSVPLTLNFFHKRTVLKTSTIRSFYSLDEQN